MINYLDLLLYRPTKKDKCERCEKFNNNILTKTEKEKKEHTIHIFQGNHMKNRMGDSEVTCLSPTLAKKHKKKKQLVENAPKTSQQSSAKDSNDKAPQK